LQVEHRYRVEQRWLSFRDGRAAFGNRVRYRLNALLPLNAPTIAAHTVYLSVYDEAFLNPEGGVFDRNCLYAGAGYRVDARCTVELGWLSQAHLYPGIVSARPIYSAEYGGQKQRGAVLCLLGVLSEFGE